MTAPGLNWLIDWIGVTFPDTLAPSVVEGFLGGSWRDMPKGGMGYRSQRACGGLKLFYDGQPGMGCHLEASGSACREYEAATAFQGWKLFLAFCLGAQGKFSRFDVAWDDRIGILDMELMAAALRSGHVVSRFKSARVVEGLDISTGCSQGMTLYFGSADSDAQLRIYDKQAEQKAKKKKGAEDTGHWIRVEFQGRDERAHLMAELLHEARDAAQVARVLKGYVDFKTPGEDSNRSRWATAPYWNEFLGVVEKERLATAPKARTLETVYNWLSRSVAPSLALLVEACDGDMYMLMELLQEGRQRMPLHLLPPGHDVSQPSAAPAQAVEQAYKVGDVQTLKQAKALVRSHRMWGEKRTAEGRALAHLERAQTFKAIEEEAGRRHMWTLKQAARLSAGAARRTARMVMEGK